MTAVVPDPLLTRPSLPDRPMVRRLGTIEFARRYVKLDGRPFDPAAWPWVVEPAEYMDRTRAATFLLKASIQSFKSGLAQLFAARQLYLEPGRIGWYSKTDPAVEQFAKEKWNPLLDNCQKIQGTLYDSTNKRTTLTISLPFGHFQMLSAGIELNRNSKSLRDIICDEGWTYEPGQLTEIFGRMSAYEKIYRIILPSSGEDEGSELNDIWRDSDQRTWHSKCPSCGRHSPQLFASRTEPDRRGGLRYDRTGPVLYDDGRINSFEFAKTVRYECPHCETDHRYAPALQTRLNSPLHGAMYVPLNPRPKERVHAWNWNALAHMDWIRLAELRFKAELALARGDLTQMEDFIRKREARAYDLREFLAAHANLDDACGDYELSEGPIARASANGPEAPAFYTLKIDVQQDHFYALVRAWWKDIESRLVWREKVVATDQLLDIQKRYDIKGHGGVIVWDPDAKQYTMPQGCGVYIDGNYNTAYVRRLAAAYHWCVLRGEDRKEFMHPDGFSRLYAPVNVVNAFEGTAQGDQFVPEIKFANTPARNCLQLLRGIDTPRRLWTYAKNAGETYIKHLKAWTQIDKKHPKTNAIIQEWKQVGDRDDYFWCEKASVVIASMAGLIGVSEEKVEDADPANHG